MASNSRSLRVLPYSHIRPHSNLTSAGESCQPVAPQAGIGSLSSMDPLSLTATAIALVTFASKICSSIASLRSLCKSIPGRLHAVGNEVADVELVLLQLVGLMDSRDCLQGSHFSAMPRLLSRARWNLSQLESVVENLLRIQSRSKVQLNFLRTWHHELPRLKELQDDIRSIKSSLNIILGATNSDDMAKLRLDIQDISTAYNHTSQAHILMTERVEASLAGVDHRIARVEEILQCQTEMLRMNQFMQVQLAYGTTSPERKEIGAEMEDNVSYAGDGTTKLRYMTPSLACPQRCFCSRHSQKGLVSPTFLSNVLGRLFISCVGLPAAQNSCNNGYCQRHRSGKLSLEYWFPTTLLSRILRIEWSHHQGFGPSLHLDTLRVVPDNSPCVNFATSGNINGLKHLFNAGLASPRDISPTRGYSLLRWALYSKQYATCNFLLQAGADAEYRPIGSFDNSPRIKACHFLLEGNLSEAAAGTLRAITRGSEHLDDFIDDSCFTKTHKIVLGISNSDLEVEILLHPDDINVQDSMGRTPLAWAASKNDTRALVTLLKYGADPNIMDVQISGPLSNAAAQGHTACVKLLLDAGANPNPTLPPGIRKGSPLNVAARNSKDPILAKILMDFGADVNQSGVDGRTSLFHAAQKDNASLAILLLENGAAINQASTAGDTPLTNAITHNSHNVLKLFLERWHEYSTCPRLKGPNLLRIAALYGDIETLNILANTNHVRLNYDGDYAVGDFRKILTSREDFTEKLSVAFDELVSILQIAPQSQTNMESTLEGGSFELGSSVLDSCDNNPPCDDSDESFKDAFMNL